MLGNQEQTPQAEANLPQYQDTGAASSEAVLRMPKKPAIELVDSRTLSLHSLFALLASIVMSFAASMWTAYATTDSSMWVLIPAVMLTALSLTFIVFSAVAYWQMHSEKHNIEVPLSSIGDLSRVVKQVYLGSSGGNAQLSD